MKLFTKDIDNKLFKQFPLGSDLSKQKAVAKIFNPYGRGRWFLLNSDPNDPNYLWAIVEMGGNVEVGSVSRSELEGIRLTPFRLGLERDLGFRPINAQELYKGLLEGKFYKRGGMMAKGGMVKNKIKDWYVKTYPTDELGAEIRDNLTFKDLWSYMSQGYDVYEVLDVHDSVVRERVFERLSEILGVDYDVVYNEWLKKHKMAKGGQIGDSGTITDKNSLFRGKMGVIVGEFDNMWQVKILDNGSERTVLVSKRGIDIVSDEYSDGGYMAKGGIVVTKVADIPNFQQRLKDGRITYRGLGMGKLSDDFYDIAGDGGVRIKVDGKEYFITDSEFEKFARDKDGNMRIRFSAPNRRFEDGGLNTAGRMGSDSDMMAGGGKLDAMLKRYATKDVSLLEKEGMMAITDTKKGVLWGSHKAGVFEFTDRDGKSLFKGNKKEAVDFVKENYTVEGMKGGGRVKFSDKVKSISKSLLKRKKVPKSVQKDYGKTFSKAEAIDSAKRIAGAMRKKEKMSKGGSLTSLKKQLLSRIKSSHSKKMTDVNLDEKTKMALRDLWLDGILIKKSVKGTQDTEYTLKKKD